MKEMRSLRMKQLTSGTGGPQLAPNPAFERMRRYTASFSASISAAHRST